MTKKICKGIGLSEKEPVKQGCDCPKDKKEEIKKNCIYRKSYENLRKIGFYIHFKTFVKEFCITFFQVSGFQQSQKHVISLFFIQFPLITQSKLICGQHNVEYTNISKLF